VPPTPPPASNTRAQKPSPRRGCSMYIPAKPAPTTTASKTAPTSLARSRRVVVSSIMVGVVSPVGLDEISRALSTVSDAVQRIEPMFDCIRRVAGLGRKSIAISARRVDGQCMPGSLPERRTQRSRNTPPATKVPEIVGHLVFLLTQPCHHETHLLEAFLSASAHARKPGLAYQVMIATLSRPFKSPSLRDSFQATPG